MCHKIRRGRTGNQIISCFAFRKLFSLKCMSLNNALSKLPGLNQNNNYDFMSYSVSFRTEALISDMLYFISICYRPPCCYLTNREFFIMLGLTYS